MAPSGRSSITPRPDVRPVPDKEFTMANITRFDPFTDFDDLFKGFLVRPLRYDLEAPGQMNVKLDVSRADDTYTVKAEMPGIKKDDISVSIDGSQVTIAGEVKKEKE